MSSETVETLYPSGSNYQDLFGCEDRNVRIVEERYGVQVVCRDGAVKVIGDKNSAKKAAKIITEMDKLISSGTQIDEHTLSSALDYLENGGSDGTVRLDTIILNVKGRPIRPRSLGQCFYVAAMMENDIVFSIGPAGTGKTFLAVAVAVAALKNNIVDRIILCRPAVEAGESLGFLPGDLLDLVRGVDQEGLRTPQLRHTRGPGCAECAAVPTRLLRSGAGGEVDEHHPRDSAPGEGRRTEGRQEVRRPTR